MWSGEGATANAMQRLIKNTSFRLATNYYIIIVVEVISDLIARACGLQLMGRGWEWWQGATISTKIRRQRLCDAQLICGGFKLYNHSSHRGGRGA